MGTTAQKFANLSDTKAAIKQAIVSKGIAVPDGTTFREYAKIISSIQDVSSLPTQGAKTVTPTTTESENGPCPCDIDKFDSGRVKANSVVIYLNNVSAARITGDYQDAGYVEFIGNYYPAFLILGDVIFNPGIN